jgi:phosphate-selective porin
MQTLTLKSLVVCGVLMLGAAATAQQVAAHAAPASNDTLRSTHHTGAGENSR